MEGMLARCPRCQELFSEPRLLPCLHTLCLPCLQRLEPFTTMERGQKLAARRSILCPVCDSEAALPPGGVGGLLPDMQAQAEVTRQRLRSGGCQVPCDLCGDGTAERRCQDCRLNMCDFCCQAHRRQKRTSGHSLRLLQELPPGSSLSPAPYCPLHPSEELRLFCEVCSVPSCRDCAIVQHQGHELRPVPEVAVKHREQLRGALVKSEPRREELEAALQAVRRAEEDLRQRAGLVREEVEVFVEGYIRAIEEHRLRLLRHVDDEVRRKEQALNLQRARTNQQLSDLRTANVFTEGLLALGPDLHLVRAKGLAIGRLRELTHRDRSRVEHVEAVSLRFSAKDEADSCQGYPLYGAVHSGGLGPQRCQVTGQGVQSVTLGTPSTFTLLCNSDAEDHGGAPPTVTILHKDSGRALQPSIEDNRDGTYLISYTPTQAGQLSVSVCVKERHIKGSPFNVTVRGTQSRQHHGVYHCCTFCSSGGQKDARCGCGGTMPGGFQGCGHGHKGHPGHSHWSCCGATPMKSECSTVKDSPPRNLLRTVAL